MATISVALVVARWVARIWSILSILVVLVFTVGEAVGGNGPRPTPQEWVGLALWPIGVCVGLVLVATVAALLPANRAARLSVVDALRHV